MGVPEFPGEPWAGPEAWGFPLGALTSLSGKRAEGHEERREVVGARPAALALLAAGQRSVDWPVPAHVDIGSPRYSEVHDAPSALHTVFSLHNSAPPPPPVPVSDAWPGSAQRARSHPPWQITCRFC